MYDRVKNMATSSVNWSIPNAITSQPSVNEPTNAKSLYPKWPPTILIIEDIKNAARNSMPKTNPD